MATIHIPDICYAVVSKGSGRGISKIFLSNFDASTYTHYARSLYNIERVRLTPYKGYTRRYQVAFIDSDKEPQIWFHHPRSRRKDEFAPRTTS